MSIKVSDKDKKNIWGEKARFKIFLSHLAESKVETSMLKNKLEIFGVRAFVAHEDINPGAVWQNEIKKALHSMDGFIALMTDGFHDIAYQV